MLVELGITPDVELVYRALLARPGATVSGLAGALEQPRAHVAAALADLVDVGLVLRSDDHTFVAAPPAVALGALITERRDGLRLAEQARAPIPSSNNLRCLWRKPKPQWLRCERALRRSSINTNN